MYVRYRGGGIGHTNLHPADVGLDEEWEDEDLTNRDFAVDVTIEPGGEASNGERSDDGDDDANDSDDSRSDGKDDGDGEPQDMGPEDGQGDDPEESVHGYAEL